MRAGGVTKWKKEGKYVKFYVGAVSCGIWGERVLGEWRHRKEIRFDAVSDQSLPRRKKNLGRGERRRDLFLNNGNRRGG